MIFNVFLYISNFYLYQHQAGISDFKPLYYYFMTIVAAVLVALIRISPGYIRFQSNFILLLLAAAAYYIVMFLRSDQSDIAIQMLVTYGEALALLVSFFVLFREYGTAMAIRIALLVVMVLSLLLNFYDFFVPSFSETAGRAAGMYVDPNYSGFMLVMMMVLCITAVPVRVRFLLCLLVGAGVLVTFSRGGWLLWGVAVIGLILCNRLTLDSRAVGGGIAVLAAILVYSLYSGAMLGWMTQAGLSDYLHPGAIARLSGDETISDDSALSRIQVAYSAWTVFTEHPWLGAGLGYTREWDFGISTHNMFLTLAAEGGVIGVTLLAWLFYLPWRFGGDIGKLVAVLLVVYSLFSHNVIELPSVMLIIAYVIATSEHSKVMRSISNEHGVVVVSK